MLATDGLRDLACSSGECSLDAKPRDKNMATSDFTGPWGMDMNGRLRLGRFSLIHLLSLLGIFCSTHSVFT